MEQTVGLPPAPSARLDSGADAWVWPCAKSGELEPDGLAGRFVLPLLPVRSTRELVFGLSKHWQRWSGAEMAVVAVALTQLRRNIVGRCRVNELPEVTDCDLDPDRPGSADRLSALFSDGLPASTERPPAAVFRFPTSDRALGGVALYARDDSRFGSDACDRLRAWSGRLIEQSLLLPCRFDERRAIDAAKLAAIAEFAAGAGHEINNPLATIAGRAQMLLREEADPDRRQALATIGAQALRVRDMIGDLMVYARPPACEPRRTVINDLCRSVVDRLAADSRCNRCTISLRETGPVFATVDPTQLQIVLSELIHNGVEAIEGTGDVRVGLARSVVEGRSLAVLSVSDTGRGLSEKDRLHLFDPFYSGREAGRGLGFGLCKCWRIATNHHGWIEVDSVPGVGATFRVFWPDDVGGPVAEAGCRGPAAGACESGSRPG